nr:hypothetical protein BaRGS_008449 [Batillaria attramentaria]
MRQAVELVRNDPKVRVIHLLRDPRGTLRSQRRFGSFKFEDEGSNARWFCQRVLEDLSVSKQLKSAYPGRVLTVRYEDLAMKPLVFAERLLGFAGLKMDKQLEEYVLNITSRGLGDSCVICTQRNDSVRAASEWRQNINFRQPGTDASACFL